MNESLDYDFFGEKEQSALVGNLVKNMNGGIALYRMEESGHKTLLFASDGVERLAKRTKEEYRKLCENDVMLSVFLADRQRVADAMEDAVYRDQVTSMNFRFQDKEGNYSWINGVFSKYGNNGDRPVLSAIYTAASPQVDLQLQALSMENVGIYIIDANTEELYYVNDAALEMRGVKHCETTGKTCYEVFNDSDCRCADCWKNKIKNGQAYGLKIHTKNGNIFSITVEKRVWSGKDIFVVLSKDITKETEIQTELKSAYNHLRRNQEATEEACDFAGMWMWIYDLEKDCIYPSKNLQRDYGMPEKLENFPQSWFDMGFIAPDFVELHRGKVQAIKDGSEEEEFECKVIHEDESVHWSRIRFNRLKNIPGYAVGTSQLIDDEKILQAKVELEKRKTLSSEKNLAGYVVTNLSKDRVVERDATNCYAPLTTVGYTLAQAMEEAKQYIHEADRDRYVKMHNCKDLLQAYKEGTSELEFVGHRVGENGNLFWIRCVFNLLKEPTSGDIFFYEYIYDINGEKMLDEIMDATAKYDYERIASVNLLVNQMTVIEYKTGDVSIWNYEKRSREYGNRVVVEEDRELYLQNISLDRVRKELADKDYYEFVCRIMESDGSIGYRRTRFSYYNREMGICLMTRADITDVMQKEEQDKCRLEETLSQAQEATRAKSEFLSRMSHEIRTPLNAIMGMTAIAQKNKADYNQVSECLDKIDLSSRYLLTLLNDILEMSRIESGRMEIGAEEFDFALLMDGIRTIVETLAEQNEIRYECVNNADMSYCYLGDRMRIQQVVVNIITNAVKFTRPGGRVRFTVESEESTGDQTMIHFTIADTGIGMNEEFMDRMFKPFTQEDGSNTSKYQGSGLGLAISKNLVDLMGGSIQAESFLGVGTTFRVVIPLKRVKKSGLNSYVREIKHDPMDESRLKNCQVLMAEDHPLNVMIAQKLLENKGIIVTVADNGKKAVELFQASEAGFYKAILMDIRMPVMDGIEATRQIRELGREDAKKIPIIAMTANAFDEDRERTKKAGMNAHLAKPFEPDQLYGTLLKLI